MKLHLGRVELVSFRLSSIFFFVLWPEARWCEVECPRATQLASLIFNGEGEGEREAAPLPPLATCMVIPRKEAGTPILSLTLDMGRILAWHKMVKGTNPWKPM